jgi:imidazolonepropionase-like amidohydrolase
MTILIADSRIVDVFPDGAKPIPAGAVVRDLRGRYVIPGLIDTHVHVATDPSGDDSRNRAEVRLRHTLLGGVTSVRDMAGDARALADLARAAKVGDIVSPRIYYSALFAGPEFFTDPRVVATSRGETVGQVPWALAVTAKTDWRLAVAQARGTGASGIKLYAALSGDLLAPLVTEAHAQGMRVWAHASLMPARPGELVKAGVDVLSHTPLVAREADTVTAGYRERYRVNYASIPATHPAMERLAGEMAAARTIVEPTLFVFFGRDSTSPPARWAAMMTGTLQRRGVTIVAGTDGMIGVEGDSLPAPGTLPNLHRELELLVHHAGLTPHQAILAATSDAARAIGIDSLVGTVTPGKLADLLVLTADPLANISNTRKIEFVVAAGKVVE